jgi:hypothetical protein
MTVAVWLMSRAWPLRLFGAFVLNVATLFFSSQLALAQFTQQGPKLVATGAVGPRVDQGRSVALSGDGNTAIVGGFTDKRGQLRLVAASEGRNGAITVHQDMHLFIANLEPGERAVHKIERGRGLWLQVARGIVALNGTEMREGDGAAVEEEPAVVIEAETDCEALLFDVA